MKVPPCPLGPKHKYEWVKDVTLVKVTTHSRRFSRRGMFRCECGQKRHGTARSGL